MILLVCSILSLISLHRINGDIQPNGELPSKTKKNSDYYNFQIPKALYDSKIISFGKNSHLSDISPSSKNQELTFFPGTTLWKFRHIRGVVKNVDEKFNETTNNITKHLFQDIRENKTFFRELEAYFRKVNVGVNKISVTTQHSSNGLKFKQDAAANSRDLYIGSDGLFHDRLPIILNNSLLDHEDKMNLSVMNEFLKAFDRDLPKFLNSSQGTKNDALSFNISQEMDSNDTDIFYSSWSKNLTESFDCIVSKTESLKVTCNNISIYHLGNYLPVNLENLEISNSPTAILSKPLFPHLIRLKYLRLFENEHRFITKAFMGLEGLEWLDLSNNNIMAIKNAFTYLPNLKYLNLSRNAIIRVGTIADALVNLKNLETLALEHNWRITRITKDELKPLRNSKLKTLTLLNTTMRFVEKGLFEHLSELRDLDMSVNYLNEESITNITSSLVNSSIQTLFLRQCTLLSRFPYESLTFLENTSIHLLDISYNYFTKLPMIPNIKTLRSLSMSQSKIRYVDNDAFEQLPNLETLVINGNYLVNMFNTSFLQNLKRLDIYDQILTDNFINFGIKDFAFKYMESLETMDLSRNYLSEKLSRYVFYGLRNLKCLSLRNGGIRIIDEYAFETLSSLNVLNLQVNKLERLSNYTFYGLHNLTDLYLSSNLLRFYPNEYPFQQQPLLRNIFLNDNKIDVIPGGLFRYIHNLEMLVLMRNKILPWSREIFHPNFSVTLVALSGNQIDYVTPEMLSDFHYITSYIDISKNPLNCSNCAMIDLQEFLKSSNLSIGLPIPVEPGYFELVCNAPKSLQNQSLLDISLPLIHCFKINEKLLDYSILTIIFLLLPFGVGTIYICYFFRWYLRYWIFRVEVVVKERRNSDGKCEKNYKYDAFVSYNSSDTAWVVTHLIPILEKEEPKLKLCIHERDFQVGRLITENILEAIETSKAVILILTEEFIRSEWCMFELHMAQHRLFHEKRDSLILIRLKDVPKKFYTKNLSYLEKTRICLKWPLTLTEQKLFWNKLKKILSNSQISKV